MSHRVIAGIAKGRKLKLVPDKGVRPIMDRVKEALFNILGISVREAHFLDLFAGTGAVGIEALSRGAAYVRFLDNSKLSIQTIHDNLNHTRLAERGEVLFADSLAYLKRKSTATFDIVFIAPPQYKEIWKEALIALDANPVHLNPDALVIVQIDPNEYEDITLENLELYDERRYGNTMLLFLEYVTEDDDEEADEDEPNA